MERGGGHTVDAREGQQWGQGPHPCSREGARRGWPTNTSAWGPTLSALYYDYLYQCLAVQLCVCVHRATTVSAATVMCCIQCCPVIITFILCPLFLAAQLNKTSNLPLVFVFVVIAGTQTVNVEGDWTSAHSVDWYFMSLLFHWLSGNDAVWKICHKKHNWCWLLVRL